MTISELDGKQVCILGFGREGRATLDMLRRYAPTAKLTIADANDEIKPPSDAGFITGEEYLNHLGGFDVIIKTPGLPWRPAASLAGRVTSATELFLNSLPNNVTVVGITGTKGKSTTSHLIHTALIAGHKRTILAGNIGEPMLTRLPEATPRTIFVLELSSYMLESLHASPHTAVITSIYPDHLDYHGSFEAYLEAKRHITEFQDKADVVFYNDTQEDCRRLASASPGRKVPFTARDFPGRPTPALDSPEGRSDLAAAFLVSTHLGVDTDTAARALSATTGLPHRQQDLGIHAGIQWVDDSAATTPQSTLAALSALEGRVDTIILGGIDRGYNFAELGTRIATADIRNLVLFPDTGAKIRAAVEVAHPKITKTYFETSDMTEAVRFAAAHTKAGRVCLLSSGAPSYNLFKDFGERGAMFQAAVRRVSNSTSN